MNVGGFNMLNYSRMVKCTDFTFASNHVKLTIVSVGAL